MERLTVVLFGRVDPAAFDAFCDDMDKFIKDYFSATQLKVYPHSLFVSTRYEQSERVLNSLSGEQQEKDRHFLYLDSPD